MREGLRGIKLIDLPVEVIMDVKGSKKRMEDLQDSLPDSTKRDIEDRVSKLDR